MRLDFTDDDLAFQGEVRGFLDEALTPELRAAGRRATSVFSEPSVSLPWQRILHAQGWVAPSWPVEYGGTGWSVMQQAIWAAECARAGAPTLAPMGLRMIGPCLIGHGTPEQKAYFLPRILSGEDYWCQGYSEPQAGSDLVALQLRAESDGDDYVLNGSKIWTTHAQHANRMFCLVRTSFEGKPQQGITFLLLRMDQPGITVKPIITLAGDHEVNQVFFDNVRVPKSDRVGAENAGWGVAKYLLEFERGGGSAPGLTVSLERVAGRAELAEDPDLRRRWAERRIEVQAMDMTEKRVLSALANGGAPGPASSMLKTQSTEAMQRVDELGVETLGPYAAVDQPEARAHGSNVTPVGPEWGVTSMARYLNDRAGSIYGGSNEVQRNIMARLVLGL